MTYTTTRGTRMETITHYSPRQDALKMNFCTPSPSCKPSECTPKRGKGKQEENSALHLLSSTHPAVPTSSVTVRRSMRQPRIALSPLQLCLSQIVQDLQMHVPDYTLHPPLQPTVHKTTDKTKPRQVKAQVYLPDVAYHVYEEVNLPTKNKVTFAVATHSKIPHRTLQCR